MNFSFNSLKFKISILALFLLAVILAVYGGFLFFTFRGTLYRELDTDLKTKAQNVNNAVVSYLNILGSDDRSFQFAVSRVVAQAGEHPHRNKIEKLEKLWTDQMFALGLNRDYVSFVNLDGHVIARSNNFTTDFFRLYPKKMPPAFKRHSVFKNVRFGKEELRVIIAPALYKDERKGVIIVGASREGVTHVLRATVVTQILLIIIILAIASSLSHIFAKRVLEPMEAISRTMRGINYKDLSVRIKTEDVDLEMKDLVDSLNEMMSRLERSFRYIAEFSSHVSHELKTPLAIMRGESEVALRGDYPAEECRKVIQDNLEEIIRMTKIIDDLLLLTRLDYDPQVFKFERFDLIEFFREIEESGKILAGEKNIAVRFDLPRPPLYMHGASVHLRRLFYNLINNALKFTPAGGRIGVSLERRDGYAFISVSDTGMGIPAENLPKIFDKFFHFETKGKNVPSGTGLGLSLAQSIAKVHGGNIQAKSIVGQGTTFTVRLPLS